MLIINTEIVAFLDADYSDYPDDLRSVVKPIIDENIDMAIGSRKLGRKKQSSMTSPANFRKLVGDFLNR